MNQPETPSKELFVFSQADTAFGIPSACVEEIIQIPPITPLPEAENGLMGLINYKGDILPVFSLFGLLGLPRKDTEPICLIVQEQAHGKLAIAVEQAQGLFHEDAEAMAVPGELRLGCVKPAYLLKAEKNICVIDLKQTFQKQ